MKADCGILNPVQRDGTSQRQRLVKALHPSFVQVDERGIDELLVYAKKYATLLRFYSPGNLEEGDWVAFIENDISTLISIIQLTSLDTIKQQFTDAGSADPLDFSAYLRPFFELVYLADTWYKGAVEGLLLEKELRRVIQSLLNTSLQNVIAFALRLEELGVTGLTEYSQPSRLRANIWDISSLIADDLLFPSGDPLNTDDLESASRKMQREFQLFVDGLGAIIQQADDFLEESLEQFPSHQPHMGLFLAFLKMFQLAQNHLNTLTRRHLNFYFQEVLQIDPLPARPDEVHMVFQLAKSFEQYLLKEQTALKGGKDENKANIIFQTDEDLLVNKAQLAELAPLKTIFIDKEDNDSGGYTITNVYAAPIANSLDGLGEEILDEEGKWDTLGSAEMPYANIGFAISSPIFLMQEGERNVQLSLYFKEKESWGYEEGNDFVSAAAREIRGNITPYYTGEKGWVETSIDGVNISRELVEGESMLKMELNLQLVPEESPFLAHNPEVHEGGLATTHPVLKLMLDNEGIVGQNVCNETNFLTTKSQALTRIPSVIQQRIIDFLNQADTWVDIAAIESSTGPVIDNPHTGSEPGNEARGYDIGEVVAQRILNERVNLGGSFSSISDLLDIDGLGIDKLNDLYYTFCFDPVSVIKEGARLYGEEVTILQGEYVLYEGYYYQALVDEPFGVPSGNSPNWQLVPRSYPYKYFQHLALQQVEIEIEVIGVKSLLLENDIGLLNPAKPFMPFGPQPKKGSKFFIGSPEVFLKSLSGTSEPEIELSLNWADLPEESFGGHYTEYIATTKPSDNNYFQVSIDKLEGGEWKNLASDVSLFHDGTDPPEPEIEFSLQNVLGKRDLNQEVFAQLNTQLGRGFIRMRLENDFLHGNYAPSITSFVGPNPGGHTTAPNQPYTPLLNSISLTYRSKELIQFNKTPFEDRVEQVFHIEPFGWKEVYPFDRDVDKKVAVVTSAIIPEFLVVDGTDLTGNPTYTDAEGTLYIGLEEIEPPQSVSILFQVAEGSADPELPPQEVVWSFLVNNEWHDFKTAEILSDTTNGLLTSGIISLALPRELNDSHTSLATSTYWIKASVGNDTPAISKAIAIMPQAVKATFDLKEENDQNRLTVPLAAESIAKLQERQAAVKKVLQPFASFNGKIAEQVEAPEGVVGEDVFRKEYNEYYIRLSERLRHKNRGITIYDYERIVLQAFPDIYKVKCLNHTRIKTDSYKASEHAPGHVKLIVLPNLQNKNAVDPMRPRVSLNTLTEIKDHVQPLISDFIQLEVKNPDFEEVQVHFKVKLHPVQDASRGFYENLLIQSIRQFLAPWIYEEGEDLSLGGKIHRSLILNHIEEQDYVDFITDFRMDHIISETEMRMDVEEAIASTSSSVLVSADTHVITFDIDEKCLTP